MDVFGNTLTIQIQELQHERPLLGVQLVSERGLHPRISKEPHRGDSMQLAPIRNVPDDLLREIFIRTLPSGPHNGSADPTLSPSILLQVCKRWKSVAERSFELWRSLQIKFHNRVLDADVKELVDGWARRGLRRFHFSLHPKTRVFSRYHDPRCFPQAMVAIGARLTHLTLVKIPFGHLHALPAHLCVEQAWPEKMFCQ